MVIRTKKDIEVMAESFSNWATYDENGKKHYFVFNDEKRKGKWTLMKYEDGIFTVHGCGDDYCDESEQVLREKELQKFVWTYRKSLNEALKLTLQNA